MVFRHPTEEPITPDVIQDFIKEHRTLIPAYEENKRMYEGDHDILHEEAKEAYKPDHRLVTNFARYVVDTSEGYFIGIPVKVSHEDETIDDAVNNFRLRNDMADEESELSKTTAIYGHAFEYIYQNEDSETCVVYNTPLDMFIVYDDTIAQKPLFAVRYQYDTDGNLTGELVDSTHRYKLTGTKIGKVNVGDEEPHYYGDVPVVEYVQNEERQSVFENVKTLINALNKALSEKMNDLSYFADSYIKILGADLDESKLDYLRDNRIINLSGDGSGDVIVEFMTKPSADDMQENMIDRLIDLIYQLSMTANMNDEAFSGSISGVAMEFKRQGMKNMAINKERKFQSAMSRRFKMVFNLPTNVSPADREEWMHLRYQFTRNIPRNLEAEANVMAKLEGVTSKETQLSVSSLVENPKEEMKRMEEEGTPAPTYDFEMGE